MAITETARLEREAEETRAQLEQTLGELRARMSPGQLLDQATGYLRNSSGRAFLGNLRDEVVHNPVPVTLIGAGIAWLAISGTIGRRTNGNGHSHLARDWGETAATAHDLAHDDRRAGAAQRAHRSAEGLVDDARDAMSEAGDSMREGMDDVRDRAGTMYDQTMGRARRAAGKAADYGRAARHAVEPDGALVNFCREQPMLVAGLGIAIGAALGAMLPTSRPERQVMGEASREMKERVRDVASEALRSASETSSETRDQGGNGGGARAQGGDGATTGATSAFERHVEQGAGHPNTESEPQSATAYAEAAEAGAAIPPEKMSQGDDTQRS
jgi:ElaB/YqjD/DUF883 family membrane-anchored ribosome-binding protein